VVTGASKGIGAAIAKQLAAEGAAVVVNYSSSKEAAERVVNEVKAAGGRAIAVKANLSKKADIDHLYAETKKAFGPIDILVNNAGVYEFSPVEQITEDHFRKQFDLNVLGLALSTQAAVKSVQPCRRQHHQHQLNRKHIGYSRRRHLQRHQGRRGLHDTFARQGTRTAQNPRQCHQSGHDRDRRPPRRRHY
jgi:NAD(P)-dependent dehydrogenase (short-subunit alcohol dehydrogenase family)